MKYFHNENIIEVGVDECARGVIFGRIYAGAVIFPKDTNDPDHDEKLEKMITDSKKLTKKKRESLYDYIKNRAIDYSVSWYSAKDVDDKGIQYCNMTAFHDCINKLKTKPKFILVDGTQFRKYNDTEHLCIKKGDSKYISIAAASILAKVEHDFYIEKLCKENKDLCNYDLLNNMGYGTKKHIEAIKKYGYSKYHRKSYKIKSLIGVKLGADNNADNNADKNQ